MRSRWLCLCLSLALIGGVLSVVPAPPAGADEPSPVFTTLLDGANVVSSPSGAWRVVETFESSPGEIRVNEVGTSTWTTIELPASYRGGRWEVAISDTGVPMFAAAAKFYSYSGGTWSTGTTISSTATSHTLALFQFAGRLVVVRNGGAVQSTDGGATWSSLASGLPTGTLQAATAGNYLFLSRADTSVAPSGSVTRLDVTSGAVTTQALDDGHVVVLRRPGSTSNLVAVSRRNTTSRSFSMWLSDNSGASWTPTVVSELLPMSDGGAGLSVSGNVISGPQGNVLAVGADDKLHAYAVDEESSGLRATEWSRSLGLTEDWSLPSEILAVAGSSLEGEVSLPAQTSAPRDSVDAFVVAYEHGSDERSVYKAGVGEEYAPPSVTIGLDEELALADGTASASASPSRNWSVFAFRGSDGYNRVAVNGNGDPTWAVVKVPGIVSGSRVVTVDDDGNVVLGLTGGSCGAGFSVAFRLKASTMQWFGPGLLGNGCNHLKELVRTSDAFFAFFASGAPSLSVDASAWMTTGVSGLAAPDAISSGPGRLYSLDNTTSGSYFTSLEVPELTEASTTLAFTPLPYIFPAHGTSGVSMIGGTHAAPRVYQSDSYGASWAITDTGTVPDPPFTPRVFNVSANGRLYGYTLTASSGDGTVKVTSRPLAGGAWSSAEPLGTLPASSTGVSFFAPRSEGFDAAAMPDVWAVTDSSTGHHARHFGTATVVKAPSALDGVGAFGSSMMALDPVNVASGNLMDQTTDLDAPAGVFGLDVGRTYNSLDDEDTGLGRGWRSPYSQNTVTAPGGYVTLTVDDGRRVLFAPNGEGGWLPPLEFNGTLTAEPSDGSYRVTFPDQTVWAFDLTGRLESTSSWDGQTVTIARDAGGRVLTATSSSGPFLTFEYNAAGHIETITSTDNPGTTPLSNRTVSYGYNTANPFFPYGLLSSFTDAVDRESTYTYHADGKIHEMIAPDDIVTAATTYMSDGRVLRQVTPTGTASFAYLETETQVTLESITPNETVRYLLDDQRRVIGMVDPFGQETSREFDAVTGWISEGTARVGDAVASDFDQHGNPLTITDPKSGETSYTYDSLDRVLSVTSPVSGTTSYDYCGPVTDACDDRIPTTITDELNHLTTNVVTDGLLTSSTDADDVTLTYGYDAMRRLETVTDELTRTTTYGYDGAGRLNRTETPEHRVSESVFYPDGSLWFTTAADDGVTSYTYDDAGRVETVTDPTGAVTRNDYDPDTGMLVTTEAPGDTTGTFKPPTTYHYDDLGQLDSITDPTDVVTRTEFDTFGRVKKTFDSDNRETSYVYDDDGRVKKTIAPDDGETETTRDEDTDQVTAVEDALDRRTVTTYLDNGLVDTVTTAEGTTEAATVDYDYDELGRRDSMVDAMGRESRVEFTPAGRTFKMFDAADNETEYFYDDAGQLERVEDPESGDRTFTYWPDGMTKTETSPGGRTTAYAYDDAGRTESMTDPAGVVYSRTWSTRGELLTDGWTGRGTIVNTYFPFGGLKTSADRLGNDTSYTYDDAGRRLTRTTPMGVETWNYDPVTGEFVSFTPVAVAGAPSGTSSYTYDDMGRVHTVTDGSGRVQTNDFDVAGQLEQVTYADGASTLTREFAYDEHGRTEQVDTPQGAYVRTYNLAGQLTSDSTPDGHMSSWSYDDAGRKASMTTPDGTKLAYGNYDGLNRVGEIRPAYAVADTFTFANGATPDTSKWVNTTGVVITGNRMVLPSTTGGSAMSSTSTDRAKVDASFTYAMPDVTTANKTTLTASMKWATTPNATYLRVLIPNNSTTATVTKSVGTTTTTLGTFTTPTAAAGVDRRMTVTFDAGVFKVWVWDPAAGDQPETESFQVTVTGLTGGIGFGLKADRTAGTNSILIDDFTKADPDGEPLLADFTYDADGNLIEQVASGVTHAWTYGTTTGQLNQLARTTSAGTITETLGYNTSGQVSNESVAATPTYTFAYDQAGQLIGATPQPGWLPTVYGYDRGRRTSVATGTSYTTYAYNERSELTTITPSSGTATTMTYDGAGRRLTETTGADTVAYGYDPAGNQTTTTSVTSGVTNTETRVTGPDGLIRKITTGGATTNIDWDPTSAIPQMTQWTGAAATVLARGPGAWAATLKGTARAGIGSDIFGSAVNTPTGTVTYSTTFDFWGVAKVAPTTGSPKLGYRGELTLGKTVQLRARDYQPARGLFTTTDPVADVDGTPTNGNPYHYVNNDPLNLIDPLGLRGAPRAGFDDEAFSAAGDFELDTSWWEDTLRFGLSFTAGAVCTGMFPAMGMVIGAICTGIVDRFVGSLQSGRSILQSLQWGFNPGRILLDAAVGAVLGKILELAAPVIAKVGSFIKSKFPEVGNKISGVIESLLQKLRIRTPAAEAADAARAAGKPGGAAAQLDVPGSRPFVDVSGSATPIRPEVQQVLDDVPISARKPWHGGCAEPRCVSQALDAGVDPRGGTMTAVQIGDKGLVPHGAVRPPCPSCEALRDAFGYDQ